jgi:hypothetical protein
MEILPDFLEMKVQFLSQIEAWREYWQVFLPIIVLALMGAGALWWRTEGR